MVMYKGGTIVAKGLYWNPIDGQRVNVREAGVLPGDETRSYMRMSPAVLLSVAPLFGMIYVMFLPLFGIGAFLVSWLVPAVGSLASAAASGIHVCSRVAGRDVFFNWNPSRAYFHGVRKRKMTDDKPARGGSSPANAGTSDLSRKGREV